MKEICTDKENVKSLESDSEFAFAAGQLVSYLMDMSASGCKTYLMLEQYMQKTKSGFLQDAITKTFSRYKHAISIKNASFNRLASQVLTYSSDIEMRPLMKFFLAGCFSNCAIYGGSSKKQEIEK